MVEKSRLLFVMDTQQTECASRLVGVLKHKAFIIGGKTAFIGLKIRSDGLSQHSMTEIFLSA